MVKNNHTQKTARARRSLSAPAELLLGRGLLEGRILDYGCGKGDLVKFLDGDIEQWDPHFHPTLPKGKFDVVCCIYVLNVLRPQERRQALAKAKKYVRRDGHLYVAVRRDAFKEGPTSTGTEQYYVRLRMKSLAHCRGLFEIYEWKNDGKSAKTPKASRPKMLQSDFDKLAAECIQRNFRPNWARVKFHRLHGFWPCRDRGICMPAAFLEYESEFRLRFLPRGL